MENKQFKLISRILSIVVLIIASFTYLATIEPTASFWDCGEFIASSYKLEVGHAPGNPVFQLIGRFFTLFSDKENAALAINAMSAMCSAFTIFFLFLTIVHFGKKLITIKENKISLSNAISVFGAGVVGSLAYCWSDTFWFSAVEGEVYAMSSLFTAVVVWAMLKWEEADIEYRDRWIVLIAFLMGLSIGVHLLNLLAIPALAFIYYYKTSSDHSFKKSFLVLLISGVILGVILYGIIPFLPKIAAYFDLFFVNKLGLPFNSGAIFFIAALLILTFWSIYFTRKKGKVLTNTILLCFAMIVIGYSSFAVVVIRSTTNTPTNEYQPDNPFTLVRYLGREQYGSNPLIYGETYASPVVNYKIPKYYTPLNGKYYKADGAIDVEYAPGSQMLFPRMWSRSGEHISFYEQYNSGRGKMIQGANYKMPSFKDNLTFFFDYQINYMYFRYFLWNFAGRQNDIHGNTPGDNIKGNWESGISFLDKARLGDQSEGPDYLVNNNAKNHYYMLPLLLGLIGLFFQLKKDNKNCWIVGLLFLLTGLAIVVYLNQPPYQVRERDYAYAGSFYAFSIWIGLSVIAIQQFLEKALSKTKVSKTIIASTTTIITLLIPVIMVSENWDDHDRSGRYTARDLAYNYLQTCDKDAILVTHGDNDTFPLWYIQEVEEVRTDIRILNTSLLGTDWYIDQMKNKINESKGLPISIDRKDYLYGTNEYLEVIERVGKPILLSDAIMLFKDPRVKINRYGEKLSYWAAKELLIPVNKENILKYGIVAPEDMDKVQDTIKLTIPANKTSIIKTELIILDILSNYQWDRPIYFVSMGGDLEIGIKDYLQYDGFSYKFVPIKSKTTSVEVGQIAVNQMYDRIMNKYKWESLSDTTIHIDYQNLYTFNGVLSHRNMFVQTAEALIKNGEKTKAVKVLDKMQEVMLPQNFPLNSNIVYSLNEFMVIQAINLYFQTGEDEKAIKLAKEFNEETLKAVRLFIKPYMGGFMSKTDLDNTLNQMYYLLDVLQNNDSKELAKEIETELREIISSAQ